MLCLFTTVEYEGKAKSPQPSRNIAKLTIDPPIPSTRPSPTTPETSPTGKDQRRPLPIPDENTESSGRPVCQPRRPQELPSNLCKNISSPPRSPNDDHKRVCVTPSPSPRVRQYSNSPELVAETANDVKRQPMGSKIVPEPSASADQPAATSPTTSPTNTRATVSRPAVHQKPAAQKPVPKPPWTKPARGPGSW